MKNNQFNSKDVKDICENKLSIEFREGKEFNGWFLLDGVKAARLTVSKGRKFIPDGTWGNMARQLLLTVQDFDHLLECSLSRADYEAKVRIRTNS